MQKVGIVSDNPALSHQLQGVGLVIGNFDGDYKSELVLSWSERGKSTNILYYRTGYNLNSQGQVQGWSANQGGHALGAGVLAIDSSAARLGGIPRLDLVHAWFSFSKQDVRDRLTLVLDPELTTRYHPTQADIETLGNQNTGFSRAAVIVQKAAGIYSPAVLIEYVDSYIADPSNMGDVIAGVRLALDDIQPPVAPEVRPELEHDVLKYYRLRR